MRRGPSRLAPELVDGFRPGVYIDISFEAAQPHRSEAFMTPAKRPLSPHLQIYQPQLTAVLSITHRATGVALSVGAVLLVWWLVAAAAGPDSYEDAQGFFGSWFGAVLLLGWTISLFYHLANGIRHLVWDTGYGFDLPTAYRSGYAVIAATAALTLIAWIAALVAGGNG
jgi:succinate dehydrogenase cytochrome b subunit